MHGVKALKVDALQIDKLRALSLALGVLQVPVTRTLVLVAISPRGHTLTLAAADSTELQAPVLPPCL